MALRTGEVAGQIAAPIALLAGALAVTIYLVPWRNMSDIVPWVPNSVSERMLSIQHNTYETLAGGVGEETPSALTWVWGGTHDWSTYWGLRPLEHCDPVDGIEPICGGGLANPRHLSAIPGNRYLLISDITPDEPGQERVARLLTLDMETDEVRQINPIFAPQKGWGDPGCSAPTTHDLHVHHTNISRLPAGGWQVLATANNRHTGGSVNFMELSWDKASFPQLTWRGCVSMPNMVISQAIALPNGSGFVATQSHPVDIAPNKLAHLIRTRNIEIGRVVVWQRGQRLRVLSSAVSYALPIGVLVSWDSRSVYTTQIGIGAAVVRRHSLPSGKLLAEQELDRPWGLNWSPRGDLIVINWDASVLEQQLCYGLSNADPCATKFSLEVLDPETLEPLETMMRHRGPPMGAVTHIVVTRNDTLYMSSLRGSRIARTTWPPSKRHRQATVISNISNGEHVRNHQ